MKKNDSIELKIEDMGVDGEGIGKYEGMTFFVKDAVIGDTIRAGITKLKKNYGYARVQEILEPSPYRVKPECPLYARCGGCQIQAMDYRQQLCYKQKKVRGNLIRIGGFAPELIDSVMGRLWGWSSRIVTAIRHSSRSARTGTGCRWRDFTQRARITLSR